MDKYKPYLLRLVRVLAWALLLAVAAAACGLCSGVIEVGELIRRLFGQ